MQKKHSAQPGCMNWSWSLCTWKTSDVQRKCQGPLQLLSPPFLMASTTKQMRPNGKGGGVNVCVYIYDCVSLQTQDFLYLYRLPSSVLCRCNIFHSCTALVALPLCQAYSALNSMYVNLHSKALKQSAVDFSQNGQA